MISEQLITNFLVAYEIPAIFLGAFFLGESVIITAAYLAATGFWSINEVIFFALVGTIVADALWFLLGQRILIKFHRWEKFWEKHEKLLAPLDETIGKQPFLLLLYFKFLYGTRIFTIVYLSIRKMKFRTFITYDSFGTVIWLAAVVAMGWYAGKGAMQIAPYINRVEYGIGAIIVIILIYKLITAWIGKKVTEDETKASRE